MIINDLRDTDFSDIGSAAGSVKFVLLSLALIVILVAGYFLFIDDQTVELEQSRQQELALMADFEFKQQKAANLEAYEQQLKDMEELLETAKKQFVARELPVGASNLISQITQKYSLTGPAHG